MRELNSLEGVVEKENFELRDSCNGMQGEYEEQDVATSVCATPTTQPIDKLKRIPFGDHETCNNHGKRGVGPQANPEGDGMEGVEQDGSPKSH